MLHAALVTGAGKRIGREIALGLAELGFDIALHYHLSEKPAQETAEQIARTGVKCALFRCDLSDHIQLKNLIETAAGTFPYMDLLVNNASVFEKNKIIDTGFDLLSRHFTVNFFAPYILTRYFAMYCRQGQVINIIDCKTVSNDSLYSAYTLSKKALAEFTKMAAKEFAPKIRVNGISPGVILAPKNEGSDYIEQLVRKVPLRKKGEPHQVVQTVKFLIENEYVTGQIIYVDGGKHL